jgi:hypothetical protein
MRLGQVADARRDLDAARMWLNWFGRIQRWDAPDSTEGEPVDYRWTERMFGTILRREAEALIVYDPVFPADPFVERSTNALHTERNKCEY